MPTATAVVLILLGAFARLAPHPPNMVAFGALALFAGARLPRTWAFAVPVLALVASDLVLDWGKGYSPLQPDYLARYAAFSVVVVMGMSLRERNSVPRSIGFSLAASTLFFLISNFAVWAFPNPAHPPFYPRSIEGLFQSYAAGLAFFNYQGLYQSLFTNTLIADLIGMGALFGAEALIQRSARADLGVARAR